MFWILLSSHLVCLVAFLSFFFSCKLGGCLVFLVVVVISPCSGCFEAVLCFVANLGFRV